MLVQEHYFDDPFTTRGVAFSKAGTELLGGWKSQIARIWDVRTGKVVLAFDSSALPPAAAGSTWGCPFGVALSPDGRFALTGSVLQVSRAGRESGTSSHDAYLWDAKTGKLRFTFRGHAEEVLKVAFTPDSKCALTASVDGTARVWSTETGKSLRTFAVHHADRSFNYSVSAIAVSPNGALAASSSEDGDIHLWRTSDATEVARLHFGVGNVNGLAFSPDGNGLAACGVSYSVLLWDLAGYSKTELLKKEFDFGAFWSIAFSRDGRYLLSTITRGTHANRESVILITDVLRKRELWQSPPLRTLTFRLAVSNDGQHVASASTDGVRLWRLTSAPQPTSRPGG
jgi:WD40 repeat protein